MKILIVILLAIGIMSLVFIGLAIQTLLKKNGKFPNTHIGSNPYMKANGVTCAQTYDKIEQEKARKGLRFKQIATEEPNTGSFC